jgi:hypothetical protein
MTKSKIPLKAGKLFILVILLLAVLQTVWFGVSAPAFAQSVDTTWVRRYNGPGNGYDHARTVAVDRSGNVYVTGWSDGGSGTFADYTTIKYHPNGDTAWMRRYNGTGDTCDFADAIAIDQSGNVYVTGWSYGSGTGYDYATIKYYSNGDIAPGWPQRYTGSGDPPYDYDYASDIAVDSSGNVYVTGHIYNNGAYYDCASIKYYPNGDTAWVRLYNGPGNGNDFGIAIAVDGSGNVYVTGTSEGSGTGFDYVTIKYDPNGDTDWMRRYTGPEEEGLDRANAIVLDDSGNVYVAGESHGGWTSYDYTTIKYYPNGDTAWVRRYNGPGNDSDFVYAIVVDSYHNVYVIGESKGGWTSWDYTTIKYGSSGNERWASRYNGPGNGHDRAYDIALDSSSNIYVTGYSYGGSVTDDDYATIKYDSLGNQRWVKRYDGPGHSTDWAYAIAVDDSANVYVTGKSTGIATDLDYATIKYVQFLCGDVNNNGIVDLGDLVYLISYLYKSGPPPVPILHAGDANCDEKVDLGDIVYLITYLYKDGPAPCC